MSANSKHDRIGSVGIFLDAWGVDGHRIFVVDDRFLCDIEHFLVREEPGQKQRNPRFFER